MKAVSRPGDNTKVIALSASVVVVFAFVVWRVISALGGSGGPPPASDAGGAIGTTGPQVKLAAPPRVDPVDDSGSTIVVQKFAPSETPNPFHKDVDSGFAVVNLVKGKPRPIRAHKDNPRMGGQIPPDSAAIVVVPDPVAIQVMGIVGSVAVVRVGDKDFVVDKGAKFGPGMRLREVSPTTVVIEEGKQVHYLKVGLTAPKPPSTPPAAVSPVPKQSGTLLPQ